MAAITVLEGSEPEHQLARRGGEVLKQDVMIALGNLTDTEKSIKHECKKCLIHAQHISILTHKVKIAEHD